MKNGVMMQFFEWYLPNNGKFWKKLKREAKHLSEKGVTAVWIPPACKGTKADDVGYGIYDLFDLGEFDQKGTVRTKYGTKEELKQAIAELHKYNISVYFDAVMNHKAAADYNEKFKVVEVDGGDRNKVISDVMEIEGATGFNYKARKNKYSDFKWHWFHFTSVDYDAKTKKTGVFLIQGEGKSFAEDVDDENGNYDFLMFADVDYKHPDVVAHTKEWGKWVAKELDLDGMRLDAIKHIDAPFIKDFVAAVREERGDDFFVVGEYWKKDLDALHGYLESQEYKMHVFDVPFHYNMNEASEQGKDYDLQNIMNDTLVKSCPEQTVTFVENHDSQEGQSLQSFVKDWFKPSAYALMLLMKEGYPCIFYGDYYGIKRKKSIHRLIIDILLEIRQQYAYGEQIDYFDHPCTVGFVRMGDKEHPKSGMALLISNGDNGDKVMNVGKERAGQVWYEYTGNIKDEVTIDKQGNGNFRVEGGNLAVWVQK